jgi:hypothetical protein
VKLPFNNIYVTWGSVRRIFTDSNQRGWYAVPLFGGKRRRVGNVNGIFTGIGVTHGQTPGQTIHKLYSHDEVFSLLSGGVLHVREEPNDYPLWFVDASKRLAEIDPDFSWHSPMNNLILQLVE